MDIIKTQPKKTMYRRYGYAVIAAAALVGVFIFANRYNNVTFMVARDSLLIDEVVEGELSVTVRGYGQLSSRDVYWIGADTDGTVARVLMRPGDSVEEGDALVELVNPQLLQQLKDMELELAAREADLFASRIGRESQLLDLKTQAANADIDYQSAKMDLDAKTQLMGNGQAIISRLEFESTQLSVQKFKQRLEMEQQRVIKGDEAMQATHTAEQARFMQTENELQKIRDQVDSLQIRASVPGIVQEMALQLGQQIARGDNVTRIARPDRLVAQVRIPELQVNDIQLGMRATVDTRTSQIKGQVSRIDPAVIEGSVLVEIDMEGPLPIEVRPDLNIEASIAIDHIDNTRYVRRPVYATAYTVSSIYRLNAEGDIAERVPVEYGQASTNYVEVLDGLNPGDRVIISDPNSFDTHTRILIR